MTYLIYLVKRIKTLNDQHNMNKIALSLYNNQGTTNYKFTINGKTIMFKLYKLHFKQC